MRDDVADHEGALPAGEGLRRVRPLVSPWELLYVTLHEATDSGEIHGPGVQNRLDASAPGLVKQLALTRGQAGVGHDTRADALALNEHLKQDLMVSACRAKVRPEGIRYRTEYAG